MKKKKRELEKTSPEPHHQPKRDREHRVGSFCGYETDGESYWPAPTYTSPLEAIFSERAGLQDLIGAVNTHALGVATKLRKQQAELWDRMLADIGLDPSLNWHYRGGRLWLEKQPEAIKKPDPPPA